jgi:hypothetical protein
VISIGNIIVTLTNDAEKKASEYCKDKIQQQEGALSIIVEEALKEYLVEKT